MDHSGVYQINYNVYDYFYVGKTESNFNPEYLIKPWKLNNQKIMRPP